MRHSTTHQSTVSHSIKSSSHPTILVFAGLDPTGGAGIQADIETLANLKVHTLPIITCLTVQDTQNAKLIQSIDIQLLQQQTETVLNDIPIDAIKLGLLSNIEIINLVSDTLEAHPTSPVIFDPILKAGGGASLTAGNTSIDNIVKKMREKIIPKTTVITPNSLEARLLTDEQDLDRCAQAILKLGCKNVFITGEHENDPKQIINTLYTSQSQVSFNMLRLAHKYHGSGCTLASAISAFIAKGFSINDAIAQAQNYTNITLQQAVKLGHHQYHPNRFIDNP